jgi:uncharacterized membrane protein YoaK (UPF0700 family)
VVTLEARRVDRSGRTGPRGAVILLAGASGAVDALCFTSLGHVFASVVTGNLALLGVSIGRAGATDVDSALVALGGFGLGLVSTGWLCRGHHAAAPQWPRRIVHCLVGEAALLTCWAGAWAGLGRAEGTAQAVLLCAASAAMGIQSSAMVAAGPAGSPSTYFTGTLTTFVRRGMAADSRTGAGRWDRWVPLRVAALLAGAAVSVALRTTVPSWAGFLPAGLVAAAALAAGRGRAPGSRDRTPAPEGRSTP